MHSSGKMHRLLTKGCHTKRCKAFSECKRHLKTLKDIPGPKPLPFLGNLHLFRPLGPYKFEYLNDAAMDLNRKYGPIVRVKLGKDMVFLFEPSAIEKVFRNEGKTPQRPLFDALVKYRSENPDKYKHLGLFTDNGPDWRYMREFVLPLLRAGATEPYIAGHCEVADDFIAYIQNLRDSKGQVKDILHHLYKYTQEAIGTVCFGTRLDCFNKNSSFGNHINDNVEKTLDAMGKTLLQAPLWNILSTPTYRALESSQNELQRVSEKFVKALDERLKDNPDTIQEQPFLASLLSRKDLDRKDLNLIVLELFQAGIDATASVIAMTLYHLGRNLSVQEKLISELASVAPLGTPITSSILSNLKYMRMCIKETMRLSPPAGGSARLLTSTLEISGYEIQQGTMVVGVHPVMSCNETFVRDPLTYEPARWHRKDGRRPTVPPFVSLPFGFGVRSCPGKQFAEQEIMIFLIKLFQKFRCNYYGDEVKMVMRLNYLPEKPVDFTLIERDEIINKRKWS